MPTNTRSTSEVVREIAGRLKAARAHTYTNNIVIAQNGKLAEGKPINKTNKLHEITLMTTSCIDPASASVDSSAFARVATGHSSSSSNGPAAIPRARERLAPSYREVRDHNIWGKLVQEHVRQRWKEIDHHKKWLTNDFIAAREGLIFSFTSDVLMEVIGSLAKDNHLDADGNTVKALRCLVMNKQDVVVEFFTSFIDNTKAYKDASILAHVKAKVKAPMAAAKTRAITPYTVMLPLRLSEIVDRPLLTLTLPSLNVPIQRSTLWMLFFSCIHQLK